MERSAQFAGRAGLILIILLIAAMARGEIAGLAARQAVVSAEGGGYTAGDSVSVDYTLPADAQATITVYADRPYGIGQRWYADATTQVAQFKQPAAKGAQSFQFKLDQIKAATTPPPQTEENPPPAPLKPGDIGALPGTYVIEVAAGGAGNEVGHVSLNLLPAGAPVPASRS
ncbi:MAG TPA: hypothetical protein VIL86_13390, partial [Tepidisphaeraceae bacterium]